MFKTLALGLILASASAFSDTHFSSSISVGKVGIGEIPTEEVTFTFMADVKKIYPGLNTVAYINVRFLSSDEIAYRISSTYKGSLCQFLGHGSANWNFLAISDYIEGEFYKINWIEEGNFEFQIGEGYVKTIDDLSCDIE